MLATRYAEYYGISRQGENESDSSFRYRVAGKLRDMGHLIEAHEAQQDARWDENETVVAGITGALAQMLQDIDYGQSGKQQVGIDIAAGSLARDTNSR